jgi:hypothetical protein
MTLGNRLFGVIVVLVYVEGKESRKTGFICRSRREERARHMTSFWRTFGESGEGRRHRIRVGRF